MFDFQHSEQIDFEILSGIGFTINQIKQLVEKADPVVLQESINHFAYGLTHNPKLNKYEEPLNVLMGVLRKGQAWFERNYQSLKEIAQKQLIEQKKMELQRKIKLEEEAYQLAFEEWKITLEQKESDHILQTKRASDLTPKTAKLSIYFKENIWPKEKSIFSNMLVRTGTPHSFKIN